MTGNTILKVIDVVIWVFSNIIVFLRFPCKHKQGFWLLSGVFIPHILLVPFPTIKLWYKCVRVATRTVATVSDYQYRLTPFYGVSTQAHLRLQKTDSVDHAFISQFDNSYYDALWDGVTGDIMHKPNRDIPRDPVTFDTISIYRTGLLRGD